MRAQGATRTGMRRRPKPPAAAKDLTGRRTSRAPTPEELAAIKKTADKYIPPKSDEDPDELPGNYRPHP